jgi:hypothetical protein
MTGNHKLIEFSIKLDELLNAKPGENSLLLAINRWPFDSPLVPRYRLRRMHRFRIKGIIHI